MKILVTGATGFLGRNLLDVLADIREPLELLCLIRNPEKAELLSGLKKPVTILHGDLLQPETLTQMPTDIDLVFHTAALVGLKNGAEFYEVNAGGTQNLVEALRSQTQLKRLVHVSSIAAVDRPVSQKAPYPPLTEEDIPSPRTDYGKSKLEAERIITSSGIPYTILRPAYIYGPYGRPNSSMERVLYDVQDNNPYTRFPFTGHASEIYAPDLGELMWKVAHTSQCENQIYFAANREPVSVKYFFQCLHQLLHQKYQAYPIPGFILPWLKKTMVKEGLDPLLGEIMFQDYFACDTGKLYRDVSFSSYYGLEGGLTRTVQWYRQQGLL